MNNPETGTENKPVQKNEPKIPVAVIAGIGMLTAVAAVLQYVQIVIPIMPSFLKFDFSDLPALIGAFAYGPLAGIVIEFLKNLIHFLTASSSGPVGPLCNFLMGAVFTGVAGLFYIKKKNKRTAVFGSLTGALVMAVMSLPINYFIVYPAYYLAGFEEEKVLALYQAILPGMKSILECLLVFNMPFTLFKGLVCVLITVLIYKPISPVLKGNFKRKQG